MRFSVRLLAIAATALSFNATPRDSYAPLPGSILSPQVQAAAFNVADESPAPQASEPREPRPASPFAWVLAAGFLGLVIARRMRSQ